MKRRWPSSGPAAAAISIRGSSRPSMPVSRRCARSRPGGPTEAADNPRPDAIRPHPQHLLLSVRLAARHRGAARAPACARRGPGPEGHGADRRGGHQPLPRRHGRGRRHLGGRIAVRPALRRADAQAQLERDPALPAAQGQGQARDHPDEPSRHPTRPGAARAGTGTGDTGTLVGPGPRRCRPRGRDAGHPQRLRGGSWRLRWRHRLAAAQVQRLSRRAGGPSR
mmetsp:Transcript_6945/g.16766  ORF Transcript_6945/g.16766 Transcript_6945/m.16766 type:complete len:224 (-) Transcript_6945:291-962(-)